VARVCSWAVGSGFSIDGVVVGFGLNGKRRRFLGLVFDPKVTTIPVEHGDRLAGVGSGVDDDLVRDMTEVLTSFSTRLDAA